MVIGLILLIILSLSLQFVFDCSYVCQRPAKRSDVGTDAQGTGIAEQCSDLVEAGGFQNPSQRFLAMISLRENPQGFSAVNRR